MDKRSLKFYISTFLIMLVIIAVLSLFFKILPYLLLAGLIAYVVVKIVGFFNNKKHNNKNNNEPESIHIEDERFDTSNAIDVDFEEVDNKK